MTFDEQGNQCRKLITSETPTVRAGNRFTFFPPVIDFSYNAVVDALTAAIEQEGIVNHAQIVDKVDEVREELNYNDLMAEARALWTQLVGSGENADEEMARRILKKVEIIFGRPMKLSEIAEGQEDLLQLAVIEMKDLAAAK